MSKDFFPGHYTQVGEKCRPLVDFGTGETGRSHVDAFVRDLKYHPYTAPGKEYPRDATLVDIAGNRLDLFHRIRDCTLGGARITSNDDPAVLAKRLTPNRRSILLHLMHDHGPQCDHCTQAVRELVQYDKRIQNNVAKFRESIQSLILDSQAAKEEFFAQRLNLLVSESTEDADLIRFIERRLKEFDEATDWAEEQRVKKAPSFAKCANRFLEEWPGQDAWAVVYAMQQQHQPIADRPSLKKQMALLHSIRRCTIQTRGTSTQYDVLILMASIDKDRRSTARKEHARVCPRCAEAEQKLLRCIAMRDVWVRVMRKRLIAEGVPADHLE